MHTIEQAAGFVLVGGASARMGRDKALLEFGGVPLLVRTARTLEEALGESMQTLGKKDRNDSAASAGSARPVAGVADSSIANKVRATGVVAAESANDRAHRSESEVRAIGSPDIYGGLGVNIVADDWPGAGPLGGIATALHVSQRPWNLIVACDLPYLKTAWLAYLLSRAACLGADTSGAEAIVPMNADGPEPLCAMYHKRAEPIILAALGRGERKVKALLKSIQVDAVSPTEWKAFDSDGLLFKNMNTPADYDEALARLGGSWAGDRSRS
jgi:molybdenum cofactor guanylyltransferase